MVTTKDALKLARKLKYKKRLTSIEKVILFKAGWIKLNKKETGIMLTPMAKKKLKTLKGLI